MTGSEVQWALFILLCTGVNSARPLIHAQSGVGWGGGGIGGRAEVAQRGAAENRNGETEVRTQQDSKTDGPKKRRGETGQREPEERPKRGGRLAWRTRSATKARTCTAWTTANEKDYA